MRFLILVFFFVSYFLSNGQVIRKYHDNGELKYWVGFVNNKWNGKYMEFYSDGRKKVEAFYKDDILHGWYQEYYESGSLFIKSRYVDGYIIGPKRMFYESGARLSEERFLLDKKHGQTTLYYEEGEIKQVQFWSDGLKDSIETYFSGNGIKQKEIFYEKGQDIWVKEYNGKGNLIYEEVFGNSISKWFDSGTKESFRNLSLAKNKSSLLTWYPNEKLKSEEYFFINVHDSIYREWYENGNPKTEGVFQKNAIRHGEWTTWFENGNKKSNITYKDGSVFGDVKFWYANGQLRQSVKMGLLPDGPFVMWYDNGQKSFEVTLVQGKRNGEQKEWYEDGQLRSIRMYNHGEPTGNWKEYYSSGGIKTETPQGKNATGPVLIYFESGAKKLEAKYQSGKKVGFEYEWYENGKLKSRIDHGKNEWLFFYEEGKMSRKITFTSDDSTGKFTTYDKTGKVESKGILIDTFFNQKIFTVAESLPEFIGGTGALYQHFYDNFRHPETINVEKRKYGKVEISLVLDRSGKVISVDCSNELGSSYIKAIEDFFYGMPNWRPATYMNTNVAFKLDLIFNII